MLTFSDPRIHKSTALSFLIIEAHLAVLMGFGPATVVNNFSILCVSIELILLFALQFSLDHIHLEACVCNLILPHRGILHSDAHQEVSLLHQHLFMKVFL